MFNWLIKYLQSSSVNTQATNCAALPINKAQKAEGTYSCEHHQRAREQYELDTTAEAFGIVRQHKEQL